MTPLMRKIPGLLFLVFICSAALLNSGTVRRKQSGVSKAQTAGIKLKDKLEELKDGEKGPATPSFGWYGGKNGFMSEAPYSKDKPSETQQDRSIPSVSEVELPEQEEDGAEGEESASGWDEDWADDGINEDEALSAKADTEEADAPADSDEAEEANDTSEDGKASKWDKDWWDEI